MKTEAISNLFAPPGGIDDRARQRGQTLGVFIAATLAIGVGVVIWNVLAWSSTGLTDLILDILLFPVLAIPAYLNRRGRVDAAAVVFLVMTIALCSLFPIDKLDRVLIVYTFPVMTASFILRPGASVAAALACVALYSALYRWHPVGQTYNMVFAFALIALSVVAYFVSHSLERAFDALHRSEQRYRAIVEGQLEMVCRFSPDFRVTYANEAARRVLGWGRDLESANFLDVLPPDQADFLRRQIDALDLKTGSVLYEYQVGEGERAVWYQWSVRAIAPADDTTEFQAVGRDITSLKTAQRLRELHEIKSRFLAAMSHELRTPLNAIIGFSDVLLQGLDGPLTDPQRQDVTMIGESGRHLLGLINDILDVSKLQAGKMRMAFGPVNLAALCESVASSGVGLLKDKPGVALRNRTPASLPMVWGDETRIRQVLFNLLSNAAKFTEAGEIELSACPAGDFVQVGVRDTGCGIPPEKQESIFEEFVQADDSSTRRHSGTGLGLPISRRFVEMHGGRMWVESVVGQGSVFYFTLPIARPNPPDPGGKRVVVAVDDDPTAIAFYCRLLEARDFCVVGVLDATWALDVARRVHPVVILLDVLMPQLDGWSVLRSLKETPETRNVPVIICSCVDSQAVSLGAADCLVKPISEQDLLNAMQRLETPPRRKGKKNVLIVDDSPSDVALMRRILEAQRVYRVLEALDGQAGIEAVQTQTLDVVILDLIMPVLDGFEVLEAIRREKGDALPVIVVTAKDLTEEDKARLNGKIQAILSKSSVTHNLAATIALLSGAGRGKA